MHRVQNLVSSTSLRNAINGGLRSIGANNGMHCNQGHALEILVPSVSLFLSVTYLTQKVKYSLDLDRALILWHSVNLRVGTHPYRKGLNTRGDEPRAARNVSTKQ